MQGNTITALVSVLHTKKKKEPSVDGHRISKYEQYGDGCVHVIYTIAGEPPQEKEKPLAISMSRCFIPVKFRKGDKLQVMGTIEPLTKKQDILYVTDICVPTEIGERAVARKMNKSPQSAREELIQHGEGFMLSDVQDTVLDASQQNISALQNFLYYHGYAYDLEMAYFIDSFFKRRVRNRAQGSVADMIMKNPLMLSELGFLTANFSPANVLKSFRLEPSPNMRLYAKVVSFLQMAAYQGDTFVSIAKLYGVFSKELKGKPKNFLGDVLLHESRDDGFVGSLAKISFCTGKNMFEGKANSACSYFKKNLDREYPSEAEKNERTAHALFFSPVFYLRKNYFCEIRAAEELAARLVPEDDPITIEVNHELTNEQQRAVKNAFLYRTSSIIGCAGSGKTAVIAEIVKIAEENKKSVVVLAPSAKAALRAADEIKLHTGKESDNFTIHKFTKILPEDADAGEDGDYLPAIQDAVPDFVVVDEMSMCELHVFSRLLCILNKFPKTHLVIVGDAMQLPAIGPQFFHQISDGLIGSSLPVTTLTKNFRAKSNALSAFGESVRNGAFTVPDATNIHFFEGSIDAFIKENKELVRDETTMFLSPQKAEITILNKEIRKLRHPDAKQIGSTPFYIGDRVVTIQNDYAPESVKSGRHPDRMDDIYNGTEGVIEDIDGNTVYVRMYSSPEFAKEGGKRIPYLESELSVFLMPAYAETVHKAQGSQFSRVVFFLPPSKKVSRNLIYTAVTRAMNELYLVGDQQTFIDGVKKSSHIGNSFFGLRVAKALEKIKNEPAMGEEHIL